MLMQIVVIHNKIDGKPRGYAFIEYEYERDMHCKLPLIKSYFFSPKIDLVISNGEC